MLWINGISLLICICNHRWHLFEGRLEGLFKCIKGVFISVNWNVHYFCEGRHHLDLKTRRGDCWIRCLLERDKDIIANWTLFCWLFVYENCFEKIIFFVYRCFCFGRSLVVVLLLSSDEVVRSTILLLVCVFIASCWRHLETLVWIESSVVLLA